ncbi:MAG: hypothetical protein ACTHLH_07160 [Solirubrobacterales bacterium]
MKRLKGPELKLSELKVPPALRDLYLDLRDRRLLPLIGLVLVAIVATPFLLGGGEEALEPTPEPIAGGPAQETASLAVLPSEPGLREPSKRLAGRPAKDPFRQQYTGPVLKPGVAPAPETASEGGSGETTVESSTGGGGSQEGGTTPAPEQAPAVPPSSGGSGGGGGSGGSGGSIPAPGELALFTFAIDVKLAHTEVTKSGAKKMSEPEEREEVLPTTPLPGKKEPALTYLGVDPKDGKEAMILVSPEAAALFGDGKCISGTTTCQLLALEPGVPEIVEYGPNGVRFKIEVLKIKPVQSGKFKQSSE